MSVRILPIQRRSPWFCPPLSVLGPALLAMIAAGPRQAFAVRLDVVVADIAGAQITSACNSHDAAGRCFVWKHVWHLDGDLKPIAVPTPRFGDDPGCRVGVRHEANYAFATIDCGNQIAAAHTEAICGERPVAWLSYVIEDDGVPERRVGYDVTVTCR
jgi:hypothetical protein